MHKAIETPSPNTLLHASQDGNPTNRALAGAFIAILALFGAIAALAVPVAVRLFAISGGLLAIVAVFSIYLIEYRRRQAQRRSATVNDERDRLLAHLYDGRVDGLPAAVAIGLRVSRSVLQLDEVVEHTETEKWSFRLPYVDPLVVAVRILRECMESAPHNGKIIVRAVHDVPAHRSEQHWWGSAAAIHYLGLLSDGIARDTIEVRRLLLVEQEESLHAEDVAPWYEQRKCGMNLRRNRLHTGTLRSEKVGDCALMEVLREDGSTVLSVGVCHVMPDADGGYIRILSSDSHAGNALHSYVADFDLLWDESKLFEIRDEAPPPGASEGPWWDKHREKPGTMGYLAYMSALRHIAEAKEFVLAVDISDTKDGLGAIYKDPSYRHWYDITCRRIGHVTLKRVYVLRRNAESVAEFLQNHIGNYFDTDGRPRKASRVAVVFADTVEDTLREWGDVAAHEWFEKHRSLYTHAERHDGWSGGSSWTQRLLRLVLRDFLLTEAMVYDYRTSNTKFDLRTLPDFLHEFDDEELRHRVPYDWTAIVDFLESLSITGNTARREELEAALKAAVRGPTTLAETRLDGRTS